MNETRSAYQRVVVGTDGNRGLGGTKGRLLGPVPADATRRSACDVLVVHTTG